MSLPNLIEQHEALCQISVGSKKGLFQYLSDVVNQHYPLLDADDIFESLSYRDRLGSTGIGHGVAVPHCRLAHCPHLITQLVTLATPLDFDAFDDKPVDIVFFLLAPEPHHQLHLDALAQISAFFNDAVVRMKLRKARNNQELSQIASNLSRKIQKQPLHPVNSLSDIGT